MLETDLTLKLNESELIMPSTKDNACQLRSAILASIELARANAFVSTPLCYSSLVPGLVGRPFFVLLLNGGFKDIRLNLVSATYASSLIRLISHCFKQYRSLSSTVSLHFSTPTSSHHLLLNQNYTQTPTALIKMKHHLALVLAIVFLVEHSCIVFAMFAYGMFKLVTRKRLLASHI